MQFFNNQFYKPNSLQSCLLATKKYYNKMLARHTMLVARNKGYSIEYNMNQNSLSNEENQSDHKLETNIIITKIGYKQHFI